MSQNLIGLFGFVFMFSISVAMVQWVSRFAQLTPEIERKLMHVLLGLIMVRLPWLFSGFWAVVIVVGVIVSCGSLVRFVPVLKQWFGKAMAVKRKSIGDISFAAGIIVLFWLADGNRLLYSLPMLILALADAGAAVVGMRFPWCRFRIIHEMKTLSGVLTFFMIALLCSVMVLIWMTSLPWWTVLDYSLFIASATAIVEAISPYGLDNFTVLLVGYFVIKLMLQY